MNQREERCPFDGLPQRFVCLCVLLNSVFCEQRQGGMYDLNMFWISHVYSRKFFICL